MLSGATYYDLINTIYHFINISWIIKCLFSRNMQPLIRTMDLPPHVYVYHHICVRVFQRNPAHYWKMVCMPMKRRTRNVETTSHRGNIMTFRRCWFDVILKTSGCSAGCIYYCTILDEIYSVGYVRTLPLWCMYTCKGPLCQKECPARSVCAFTQFGQDSWIDDGIVGYCRRCFLAEIIFFFFYDFLYDLEKRGHKYKKVVLVTKYRLYLVT